MLAIYFDREFLLMGKWCGVLEDGSDVCGFLRVGFFNESCFFGLFN